MTFTQSFPASTTAYPSPTQATPQIARLLVAAAENELRRDADAQWRAFRLNAIHEEVDEDVALDGSLEDEGLGHDGEATADEGRVVVGDAGECAVEGAMSGWLWRGDALTTLSWRVFAEFEK